MLANLIRFLADGYVLHEAKRVKKNLSTGDSLGGVFVNSTVAGCPEILQLSQHWWEKLCFVLKGCTKVVNSTDSNESASQVDHLPSPTTTLIRITFLLGFADTTCLGKAESCCHLW